MTTVPSAISSKPGYAGSQRTIPSAVDTLNRLQQVGIDVDEVGPALETQGIERFRADQQSAIDSLETKVGVLIPTRSTPDLADSRAIFEAATAGGLEETADTP